MKGVAKAIVDGKVVYVFEDPEKASRFLTSLHSPLYTNYRGELLKLTNIRNVIVTVQFEADSESLGVLTGDEAKNSVVKSRFYDTPPESPLP